MIVELKINKNEKTIFPTSVVHFSNEMNKKKILNGKFPRITHQTITNLLNSLYPANNSICYEQFSISYFSFSIFRCFFAACLFLLFHESLLFVARSQSGCQLSSFLISRNGKFNWIRDNKWLFRYKQQKHKSEILLTDFQVMEILCWSQLTRSSTNLFRLHS